MSESCQEQQINEKQQTDQDFQFFTEGPEIQLSDVKQKFLNLSSAKCTHIEEEDQSFKISPSNMNSQRENVFQFGQKNQNYIAAVQQQQYSYPNGKELQIEQQLQQANERLDNMLRLNDYLKKENAQIQIQKKRLEDNYNQQTLRYAAFQRKYSQIEKYNKDLQLKVNQLESEKKQLLQKWQKASNMLKDEQNLKGITKNIENLLISATNEFNQLNAYLSQYPKQLLNIKQNLTGIQEKLNVIVNFQDEYLNLQLKSTNLTIRTFAKEQTVNSQESQDQTQDLKLLVSLLTDELSELRYILYVNKKEIENKNSQIEQLQNRLNTTTTQFSQFYNTCNTIDRNQQSRRMPSYDQDRILREITYQPNITQDAYLSGTKQQRDSYINLLMNQKENKRRSSLQNSGREDFTPQKSHKKLLSSSQKKMQQTNQNQYNYQNKIQNSHSLSTSYI
ncbi:hypothetical protein TTHERM_00560040 (macronuclear) [Tetrahymena thermophila SB210]|uniref:Uncharacterized protein n=1 Tax=Tetrahymena thermophila (strain SB210) TaxID=312017 RepID=I7MDM9_TETTS|nr:hypothetical protein TTHERM_00560040 [Tetrahymena thermophila SB210]EAR89913.2 hypothetical protein TTHERM_00560040 [Tetrahymena thermophila SB210]|eukprot:XP_001010158.2 hypothetical protein TTHERM_00560040 [Tetrahymena thermophila SB210]